MDSAPLTDQDHTVRDRLTASLQAMAAALPWLQSAEQVDVALRSEGDERANGCWAAPRARC
jgi:hypothetical protein